MIVNWWPKYHTSSAAVKEWPLYHFPFFLPFATWTIELEN